MAFRIDFVIGSSASAGGVVYSSGTYEEAGELARIAHS